MAPDFHVLGEEIKRRKMPLVVVTFSGMRAGHSARVRGCSVGVPVPECVTRALPKKSRALRRCPSCCTGVEWSCLGFFSCLCFHVGVDVEVTRVLVRYASGTECMGMRRSVYCLELHSVRGCPHGLHRPRWCLRSSGSAYAQWQAAAGVCGGVPMHSSSVCIHCIPRAVQAHPSLFCRSGTYVCF